MDCSPIGVFDSGVGGLTVLKELLEILPNEHFIYFGDTNRVPYGTKPQSVVERYVLEIVAYFKSRNAKAVVIACNTATGAGLEAAVQEFPDMKIIGVIESGVDEAIRVTKQAKIGLLATDGTVRSEIYQREILHVDPTAKVLAQGCPKFVECVEAFQLNSEAMKSAEVEYLMPMKGFVDTIILGCTHFPIIEENIRAFMGPEVVLVNPAKNTALKTRERLSESDQLCDDPRGSVEYHVSKRTDAFPQFIEMLFQDDQATINVTKIGRE